MIVAFATVVQATSFIVLDVHRTCCATRPDVQPAWLDALNISWAPPTSYGPPCTEQFARDFCLHADRTSACTDTEFDDADDVVCPAWAKGTCGMCQACVAEGCPYVGIDQPPSPPGRPPPPSPPPAPSPAPATPPDPIEDTRACCDSLPWASPTWRRVFDMRDFPAEIRGATCTSDFYQASCLRPDGQLCNQTDFDDADESTCPSWGVPPVYAICDVCHSCVEQAKCPFVDEALQPTGPPPPFAPGAAPAPPPPSSPPPPSPSPPPPAPAPMPPPAFGQLLDTCCAGAPSSTVSFWEKQWRKEYNPPDSYGATCRRDWIERFCMSDTAGNGTYCSSAQHANESLSVCPSWSQVACGHCTTCFALGCPFSDEALAPSPSPPPSPGPPGSCPLDVVGMYGDVRDGSGGFAPILGVACGGTCYEAASQWSEVAVAHGDAPVAGTQDCRDLCGATDGCEVWSFDEADGTCTLMRHFEGAQTLGTGVGTESVRTGSLHCGTSYLPFPEGLPAVDPSQPVTANSRCFIEGGIYGGGAGVCGTAPLLAIHATQEALDRGLTEAWWTPSVARGVRLVAEDSPLTAELCQARCQLEPSCAGLTVSAGVCQLRGSLSCSPKVGLAGAPSTSDLVGSSTVVGFREGCVDKEEIAAGAAVDPYYTACDTPRCSVPTIDGYFLDDGTFAPESCHYDYLDAPQARSLLAGKWLSFTGGSNTLLFGQAVANLLTGTVRFPGEEAPGNVFGAFKDAAFLSTVLDAELLDDWLTRSRNSDVNLLDIVWEADSDGGYQLAHMHSSRWDDIETAAGVVDGMWTDAREDAIRSVLQDAPAYSSTAIRLTVVLSQYLPSSKRALNAVATVGDTWDAAPVVASVQNGAWYIICGIKNEDACNRPAIKGSDAGVLTNTYLAELDGYGEVAEPLCSSDRFTCFYATDAYVGNMGALVQPAMDWLATKPWIHAINYYGLGQKKPDDINRGHGSPFLNLMWAQMMMNALLPAPPADSQTCAQQNVMTESCFGSTLRDPVCGEACSCTAYDAACVASSEYSNGRCQGQKYDRPWECSNERVCTMQGVLLANASSTTSAGDADAASACGDINLVAELAYPVAPVTVADADVCPKNRLWCADRGYTWMLTVLAVAACVAYALLSRHWATKAKAAKAANQTSTKPAAAAAAPSEPVRRTVARGAAEMVDHSLGASAYRLGVRVVAYLQPKTEAKGEHLAGLTGARILASIHIVVGHLYAKGVVWPVYMFGWGFTWVPWFFMLSGFVLTHAQLSKKDPSKTEPILTFLRKRTSAIYPLYAVGLILAQLIVIAKNGKMPKWYVLVSQAFLAQAWFPWLTEQTLQLHCWFLSAMVPYWALFGLLIRFLILKLHRLSTTFAVLLLLALPPWFAFALPQAYQPQEEFGLWYSVHQTGSLKTWTNVLVVFLKFNPLAYFHVFVFGMVLARLRERVKVAIIEKRKAAVEGRSLPKDRLHAWLVFLTQRALIGWGNAIGYAILLSFFCLPAIRPFAHKISARLSILMIPQGLVILGNSPLPAFGAGVDKQAKKPPADDTTAAATAATTAATTSADAAAAATTKAPPTAVGGIDSLWRMEAATVSSSSTAMAGADMAETSFTGRGTAANHAVDVHRPAGAAASLQSGFGSATHTVRLHTASQPAPLWVTCCERLVNWLEYDPIHRIFKYAPASWGNVSYGQYVLQMICYDLWPVVPMESSLILFMVFLLALSWLSAPLVTEPARSWWLQQKAPPYSKAAKLWSIPVALVGIMLSMSLPYRHFRVSYDANIVTPPVVYIAPGAAVDVRLNWTAPAFEPTGDDPRVLINPSLLVQELGDSTRSMPVLVRAARAHAIVEHTGMAMYTDEDLGIDEMVRQITTEWRSDIVISTELLAPSTDLAGWNISEWGLDGHAPMEVANLQSRLDSTEWGPLCEPVPTYLPANNTLLAKRVTGAEDPKLFELRPGSARGEWGIAYSSLPPADTRPGCHRTTQSVYQMYAASSAALGGYAHLNTEAPPTSVGMKLECGNFDRPEKNWIAFTHDDQLHFVYSIFPHVVVQARPADGACVQRYTSSSYQPLAQLVETGDYRLHGSATAVRYKGAYLALMHTLDTRGKYVTMAYKFEAKPPFKVVAVSRPLPLAGGNSTNFASGLLVLPTVGKVIVSYGSNDAESRALVMSTGFLDELFDPCAAPPPPPSAPPGMQLPLADEFVPHDPRAFLPLTNRSVALIMACVLLCLALGVVFVHKLLLPNRVALCKLVSAIKPRAAGQLAAAPAGADIEAARPKLSGCI